MPYNDYNWNSEIKRRIDVILSTCGVYDRSRNEVSNKKTYGCAVKGPSIGFLHGQSSGLVRFGVDVDWTLGLGAEELVPNVARSRSHLARRQRFQMLSRFPKPTQQTKWLINHKKPMNSYYNYTPDDSTRLSQLNGVHSSLNRLL